MKIITCDVCEKSFEWNERRQFFNLRFDGGGVLGITGLARFDLCSLKCLNDAVEGLSKNEEDEYPPTLHAEDPIPRGRFVPAVEVVK